MELIRTPSFEKSLALAPREIQYLCERQLERLVLDPSDPRLHRKPFKGQAGVYTFRITRRYRGFFYINIRQEIIVFTINHRKDAYR